VFSVTLAPRRGVAMPRALSASAISMRVRAPAFCASRMIGSTLAAYLSASTLFRENKGFLSKWRAAVDEDGHYCFTVAL
jgi:hypothetical protein